MLQIFKKEMKSYLLNPLGYIYLTIFFIITSVLFVSMNVLPVYSSKVSSNNFAVVIVNLRIALMIFIPAITMKLLVEERRNKTEQLLFTSPVTINGIVIGKFLAATAMLIITLLITMLYPLMLSFVTEIYIPSLITSYIGFLLVGMSLIAMCMFFSSFTENPIIAFLIGIGSIFFIWISASVASGVNSELLYQFIDAFSLMEKMANFIKGVLDITVVFYYVTIIVMFIFLTIRQIEKRRIG